MLRSGDFDVADLADEDSENSERKYPVVYMLHGGRPGSEMKLVPLLEYIHPRMEAGEAPLPFEEFASLLG